MYLRWTEFFNNFSGEAIADGCALKTEYFSKHHGLSEEDKNSMTIHQLENHENQMMERNAWCIAEDVAARIDSEPGPGESYMQSVITDHIGILRYTQLFYIR